jgi:hypothetical protein
MKHSTNGTFRESLFMCQVSGVTCHYHNHTFWSLNWGPSPSYEAVTSLSIQPSVWQYVGTEWLWGVTGHFSFPVPIPLSYSRRNVRGNITWRHKHRPQHCQNVVQESWCYKSCFKKWNPNGFMLTTISMKMGSFLEAASPQILKNLPIFCRIRGFATNLNWSYLEQNRSSHSKEFYFSKINSTVIVTFALILPSLSFSLSIFHWNIYSSHSTFVLRALLILSFFTWSF